MPRPLDGVRVLDFTIFQQGPQGTAVLADFGADVIKVEPPLFGDLGRAVGVDPKDRFSAYFHVHNRGKRSITLNLKTPEAIEIVRKLAARADVLTHNYRGGVMERLGLTYEAIRGVNPRIIYAHASGWGSRGPKAEHPAFDIAAQARGGLISVTGEPDGYPLPAGAAVSDYAGAMNFALGIITALYHRERTGVGQKIETSLLGTTVAMQSWEIQTYIIRRHIKRAGRGSTYLPTIWRVFRTADGYAVIGGVQENRWPAFCRCVGRPELEQDARFATFFVRYEHMDELYAILEDIFPTRTTAEWMATLEAADMICAPVADYEEVVNDAQVLANGYITEVEHPSRGPLKTVGLPWTFSETPADGRALAPELGQHTEEVLLDLGYTWDEIGSLREKGVL